MNMYKEESWFRRIRRRRRLTLIDDDTLREFWHIHVSGLGVFTVLFFMFLITIGILSLLIIYTPFRNILPGYSASLRQDIIEKSMRIDSLQHTMDLQTQYIAVIRDVVAGEAKTDTVVSLDSLQIVMQERLLERVSGIIFCFSTHRLPLPSSRSIHPRMELLFRPLRHKTASMV